MDRQKPNTEKVYVKDLKPNMNGFNMKVIVLRRVINSRKVEIECPKSVQKYEIFKFFHPFQFLFQILNG